MHCEGCGFCLPTLECLVRGRAHPNTDKWLFQKWRWQANIEEILTATLLKEHVSSDEELDLLSNPLLASPPGEEVKKKDVQSFVSEVDLFAPPPTAPVPQQQEKGKKALPSAPPPPMPQQKVTGKKALPSAPHVDPSTSKRYSENHPERNSPFGCGRLADRQGYLVLVEPRALPHGN